MTCERCPASFLCLSHSGYCRLCTRCHAVHFNGGTDLYIILHCSTDQLRRMRGSRQAWLPTSDCPACTPARHDSLVDNHWQLQSESTQEAQLWVKTA